MSLNNLILLSGRKKSTIYTDVNKHYVYKVFNNIYKSYIIHNWLKEIIFLKNIKHENIINLIDYNVNIDEHKVIIIYPYYNCIAQKNIFTDADINICLNGLFNGLEYCHFMGILHKDIKPSNLFYIADDMGMINKLIIGDFGLSSINVLEYSRNNHFVFSYTHCAPEIFIGNKGYTIKSDIWACGICLIYFMTGMSLYDLSIHDSYFITLYDDYLKTVNFEKRKNNDVVRKIMKELHQILVTDRCFKEKIINLACSKRRSYTRSDTLFIGFYNILLNNMLEQNPNDRIDIKDIQLLVSNYFTPLFSHDILTTYTKRTIYLFDWIESISLDETTDRNIMKTLNAYITYDNITLIQKRFLINKTIKLIELYSKFNNSLKDDDILLCLQIILLLGFSDQFIINKEILYNIPKVIQTKVIKNIIEKCDFLFMIPNIFT